jgi:uncharacterized membrane protein YjjP (DUF1212 family)
MLEKERKINNYIMLVGALVSLSGFLLYLMGTKIPGISILVVGVVVFMISVAVSNFFYRFDMSETFGGKKKN